MSAYAKFLVVSLFSFPITAFGLLHGGAYTWVGYFSVLGIMVFGDVILEKDIADYSGEFRNFNLDFVLCMHLPYSLILLFIFSWQVTPGDIFEFGKAVEDNFGWNILARHNETGYAGKVGAIFSLGLFLAEGAVVGHELIHRIHKPVQAACGKWIFALYQDTQFTISHIYCHHKNVGFASDPSTARRGEILYSFVFRSAIGQLREAWNIERLRLEKSRRPVISFENRFLTGQLMGLSIFSLVFFLGSWTAFFWYLLSVGVAKFKYETINYIQHYGLVRVPGTPVEPRHSWDSGAKMSSNILFFLTRHADHHSRGDVPFWELRHMQNSLQMRYGYLSTFLVATVPPIWRAITKPGLEYWDNHLATEEEKKLLKAKQL